MKRIGLVLGPTAPEEAPESLLCPHCGKGYKSTTALKAHCKKEHPEHLDEDGVENAEY